MRNQNPPPGSSPFGPNHPTAAGGVSPQSHHVGPTTNASSDHINPPTNDENLQNSEPTSLQPANAQSQLDFIVEGADEADAAHAIDGAGTNDHDMVSFEEGIVPLSDIDMEETNGLSPMSTLQSTSLENDTGDMSAHTVAPQILTGPAAGPVVPSPPTQESQQDVEGSDVFDLTADELETQLDFVTGGNTNALMPDNCNSYRFLRFWRWLKNHNQLKDIRDTPRNTFTITDVKQPRITYAELTGDEYDLQGINWQRIGVTRSSARKCRIRTFRNFTNVNGSDIWNTSITDTLIPRHENYFRFRSMDIRPDVRLLHFQLRNIMACASRTAVYYPSTSSTIRELDPTTGYDNVAMRFKNNHDAATTTLAAEQGFLVAGGFHGTYHYRRTETEDTSCCYDGRLTDQPSGITNHVQISSSRRSSVPLACFASNDHAFRIVDLARNEVIFDKAYEYALNCTALSPDKRLRVMVGDRRDFMITEAETGECLQNLTGHRDFGFACAWAPDGWTVATGNQDKSIKIWDARKWTNSKGESNCVAAVRAEMAGIRSLRFSPLGSGKRLLLAAEEADVINVIDAQTFNSKQTIDIFGELAGISFASAGQEVLALSSDPIRGGVLCLERCDYGAEDTFNYLEARYSQNGSRNSGYDWLPTPQEIVEHPDSQVTLTQKQRQAAMREDWFF
ncbi:WD40-repeat-containing domain protein [Xylaria intraflava]|nr:WD40-repeat-containing domain protein [Xylaria intraflava]